MPIKPLPEIAGDPLPEIAGGGVLSSRVRGRLAGSPPAHFEIPELCETSWQGGMPGAEPRDRAAASGLPLRRSPGSSPGRPLTLPRSRCPLLAFFQSICRPILQGCRSSPGLLIKAPWGQIKPRRLPGLCQDLPGSRHKWKQRQTPGYPGRD
jgi:hypothetical protein